MGKRVNRGVKGLNNVFFLNITSLIIMMSINYRLFSDLFESFIHSRRLCRVGSAIFNYVFQYTIVCIIDFETFSQSDILCIFFLGND